LTSESLVTPGPRAVEAAMSNLISVPNTSHGYAGHPVLDSVNFLANGGEFVVPMGVNGAGKSTLLDIIAGLRTSNSGEVLLQGKVLGKLPARERSRLEGGRHRSHREARHAGMAAGERNRVVGRVLPGSAIGRYVAGVSVHQ